MTRAQGGAQARSAEASPRAACGDARSVAIARAHRRYGWTALLAFLVLGYALEALNGFKASAYLLDPLRREFWTLAHLHGAFLALLNLIYASWVGRGAATLPAQDGRERAGAAHPSPSRAASRALLAGSALLPLGFFLGGLVHFEGDPGLGIALVPIGALAVLYSVGAQARAAWRREPAAGDGA